jgi:zinc transporter ZupT
MYDMVEIVVAGFAVMGASLAGVLFVGRRAEQWLGERLSYLVAFSAGVFLVTGGALALEVFHLFEEMMWLGLGLIALGYGAAWCIEYVLPESHHHHDPHDHDHHHGKASARKIIVGDAIHNIGDGIMLVPAFMVSPALGLAVTLSVLVHETLQEISEFFVLRQAGYTTKRALVVNFFVSSTVFLGIGLAYFAVATHELEGVILALSAGFFLHVVVHDLTPQRRQHESFGLFLRHVGMLLVGLGLMAGVSYAVGDAHTHGETQAEDHAKEDAH